MCVIDDPFTHKSARPSVEVSIEGYRALALIDSGAKISAISRTAFIKISEFLATHKNVGFLLREPTIMGSSLGVLPCNFHRTCLGWTVT